MTWFQIWTVCWQVAVFLTPTFLGCAILWLRSQFVTKAEATSEKNRVDAAIATLRAEEMATAANTTAVFAQHKSVSDQRYDVVKDKTSDHEGRIKALEGDAARPPTRHQLNNAIATMQGGIHAVERRIDDMFRQTEAQGADLRRQMETLNSYLHTVIEKHLG